MKIAAFVDTVSMPQATACSPRLRAGTSEGRKDFVVKAGVSPLVSGPPTPEQMERIRTYQVTGFEPLIAEELYVVTAVVADNLVNRTFGRWSVRSIESMARLIIGVPATLDHDWQDVRKVWGRTFDATVVRTPAERVPAELLERAGNGVYNREIVREEGLVQCVASAYTPIDHPIIPAIRYGQCNEVSTGGFDYTAVVCPECRVPFGYQKCRHYPPSLNGRNTDDPNEQPYFIRDGLVDVLEWSLVVCPNLPGVGII